MDTEFTTYNRKDLLLVSGAMVNCLDKYKPVKLEGTPLILTTDNRLAVFKRKNYTKVVNFANKIFNKKPKSLNPLLKQLETSVYKTERSTLSTVFINKYLFGDHRIPILVFWSGTTDFSIV